MYFRNFLEEHLLRVRAAEWATGKVSTRLGPHTERLHVCMYVCMYTKCNKTYSICMYLCMFAYMRGYASKKSLRVCRMNDMYTA